MNRASRLTLRQLSRPIRISLAMLLATAASAIWPPRRWPILRSLRPRRCGPISRRSTACFFGAREKPVSPIERLLESTEGPMNSGGTMRPAFTTESTGWNDLIENMPTDELAALTAQREGERLALLEWVRSGADRSSYEADDYRPTNSAAARQMTVSYLVNSSSHAAHPHAHQRPLRHLSQRKRSQRQSPLVPARHLRQHPTAHRPRVDSSPAGALANGCPFRARSADSRERRYFLVHVPSPPGTHRSNRTSTCCTRAALGCWLFGQPGAFSAQAIFVSAAVAAAGVTIQIVASLGELLAPEQVKPAKHR